MGQYYQPIIAIYGPTASGKSALATEVARQFGGEIICADSRTVYKGMDIGTAKPTTQEQKEIPHHLLDIVEPGDPFSAYDFKILADEAVAEIRSRGKLPIMVGGTGLYMDAVLYDYTFSPKPDASFRQSLESMSLQELYEYCDNHNILLPENYKNKRHVVRNIERNGQANRAKKSVVSTSIIVGISTERDTLRKRIAQRIEHMFAQGVVEESILLGKKYGWESEAMKGNIYRVMYDVVEGNITMSEAQHLATKSDWKLARRQLTWLRRNKDIHWCDAARAQQFIAHSLDNLS